MAQGQRKQAGWKHEIDRIAGMDFEKYVWVTTAKIKLWRRLAIVAIAGWAAWLVMAIAYTLEVIK